MVWPTDGIPLPIRTEFYIDGAWTSAYSSRVRADGKVTIVRGQSDQQSSLGPQTSDFTLNSRDGLFSNRNPLSPLYGKFGRNTRVRHSVLTDSGTYDAHFLKLWQTGGTYFSTADKAVLDITGDIDIRVDLAPATWKPDTIQVICGKWATGQLGWLIGLMPDGTLRWVWSADGANSIASSSSNGFHLATGRYSIRVTVDVDNGSGQRVISFYWADSINGPWNSLGVNTNTGTTSIWSNSAPLEVGGVNGGTGFFNNELGFVGKIYAMEVYQGILGTLRADFDATVRSPGDTTWSDGLGTPNTWTQVGTNGRITSDRVRFTGEISSIPQKWDVTGRDVYLPIRASGALRRLIQGGQPIRSAIYRNLIQYSNINGYWPMEADSGATVPDSAVPGNTSNVPDASFSGSVPAGLAGSAGAATLNSADSRIYLYSPGRASTGSASFIVYFKLAALPASDKVLMEISGNGGVSRITLGVSNIGFAFTAYSFSGSVLATDSTLFGAGASPLNQWIGMNIVLTTSGANVRWEIQWHAVGTDIFYTPTPGGTTFGPTTVGRLGAVRLDARADAAFTSAQFAHVLLTRDAATLYNTAFRDSSAGYVGETAGARILRLAGEEAMSIDMYGNPADTIPMGPQRPDTVLNLWQECAVADGGLIAEARDVVGLQYVPRHTMGDIGATFLNYANSDLAATPEPVDDDRYLLNDVTASRPGGSSARATLDSGPLSTQDPPNGVGRYEGPVSKNVSNDDALQSQAEWEVFWRTWDEPRIPDVTVGLHRSTYAGNVVRTGAVLSLGVGTPITLQNLPSFIQTDEQRLISFGYTETLEQYAWTLRYNTVPYGPYRSWRIDSLSHLVDEPRMAASEDNPTVLNAALTTTATSIVINTPTGYPRWANSTAHASEFPFDAWLGGERITITACTVGAVAGGNWQQTLTATRSVNGIVKSHLAGAEIDVWSFAYLSLGA